MISAGKWAPLKLIAIVTLPLCVLDHLRGRSYPKCVPNENLRQNLLKSLPGEIGAYSLSEMTLAVTVTAKGSVSLLGSGGELTGQGGITLKLTRKP